MKTLQTALAAFILAAAQPAVAEILQIRGVPVPPIQTAEQARAETEKRLAAIQAEEAKQAAEAAAQLATRDALPATTPQEAFYTGKPLIEETGQYAFLFRSYNPELGRWTSADPSGFPDGANNLAYIAVPTSEFDLQGLSTYSIQLSWHWLFGNGSTVNLPWSAFDPDDTTRNLAGVVWRSENLGMLLGLGNTAAFGNSSASPATEQAKAPGFSDAEPVISHFDVFAYLRGSISINKYWVQEKWQADLSWTLGFSAVDKFDFNPGDRFGPGGLLQDDWFIAFQNMTGVPKDFMMVSYTEYAFSYTVYE